MLYNRLLTCLLAIVLGTASLKAQYPTLAREIEQLEVPVYQFEQLEPTVALRMDYAGSAIQNPDAWLKVRDRGVVKEIDLVFTLYPLGGQAWRERYEQLIQERMRSLFALDPSLRNAPVHWRLVVQTKCKDIYEARSLFHGFVLRYKVTRPQIMDALSSASEIEEVLSGKVVVTDTSVRTILDRNRHWKKVLVIMDWTGSMYQYGAQLVLWHKLNMQTSGIQHMVLFNDGDRKSTQQKVVGRTGGVYYTRCQDLGQVIETISTVMHNGYGGDSPENDLEAVVQGIQRVSDYEEVLLIADNRSRVRDMALLNAIKKPVRVLLCGKGKEQIHPDYLRIAYKTRGSIHTVEEDIVAMASLNEGDMIEIEGFRYKVRAGELERFE